MKKLLACVVWFGIATHLAAGGGDEKPTKIEGTWLLTKAYLSKDEKKNEENLKSISLTYAFKDGGFVYSMGKKELASGTYKVDTSKKPFAIDLSLDGKGTRLGIFALDSDMLTIAISKSDSRPKDFEATDEIGVLFFKRQKSEK
jgi:uncharacterized protein (TIGR03067 family)